MRSERYERGNVYYADLGKRNDNSEKDSEQYGIRPVVIIQNDIGNKYSPTVIVAAVTSQINKAKLPTHVELDVDYIGLNKKSVLMLEQIRTLDKRKLISYVGKVREEDAIKMDEAMLVSLQLTEKRSTTKRDVRSVIPKPIHTEEKVDRSYIEKSRKNIDNLVRVYNILKQDELKESITFSLLELKRYCIKHDINYKLYTNRYNEFIQEDQENIRVAI